MQAVRTGYQKEGIVCKKRKSKSVWIYCPYCGRKTRSKILKQAIGSELVSLGTYNFAIVAQLPLAGFTGVVFILKHLFCTPAGWTIIDLNIAAAVLGTEIAAVHLKD